MLLTADIIETITQKLVEAAIETSKNNVKIIGMYGSRAKGIYHSRSDLEFFAITDDSYTEKISFEFFYNEIPIDLWSIQWSDVKKLVSGKEYWCLPAGTYATGKVVYSRTEEDLEEFLQIREELNDPKSYHGNLLDQNKEVFARLHQELGRLVLAKVRDDQFEARAASQGVIISVTYLLSHINGKYYTDNWGLNLNQAFRFEKLTDGLHEDLQLLATSLDFDSLIDTTIALTEKMRELMQEVNAERNDPDYRIDILSDSHYYGVIAYINKIIKAIDEKNIFSLSYATWELQESLAHDAIMIKEKKWSKAYDYFTYKDFKPYFEAIGFPSFFEAVSNEDFEKAREHAIILQDRIEEIVQQEGVSYRYFDSMTQVDGYFQSKIT
ncbi:MAG: hypothetical protein ACW98K_03740 [Candidatus Kariarchaeaceae archaeon]|jgi:hypothetical protein